MKHLLVLSMLAGPLFAGSLALEIGNPSANPEALAKHAVLVARMTACTSPEKTTVTASAEGIVDGTRKSIPLKIVALSTAGTYAVVREWPAEEAGRSGWSRRIRTIKTTQLACWFRSIGERYSGPV